MSRSRASSCGARRAGARRRPRASARSSLADVDRPALGARDHRHLHDQRPQVGAQLRRRRRARRRTTSPEGRTHDDVLRRQGPRRRASSPARASRRSRTSTTTAAGCVASRRASRVYTLDLRRAATGRTCASTTRRRTELTYDDADRVIAIKRPGGGTERYEYDAEGARTAVVQAGGQRHVLRRDARGALAAYEPLAGASFDARPRRRRPADGRRRRRRPHDATATPNGRATGAAWADAAVEYGYDGAPTGPPR